VVGIILVISLLTVPPAIAKFFTYDLKKIMLISSLIGMIFSISGLTLSYYFNIPSGAMIILLTGAVFFLTALIKRNKSSN
jgi:zinc transport system permease protein